MNLTRDRIRSIGWAFVLSACFAVVMALTFQVNAVKSKVRLAERQIVSLQHEKLFLETEFEARANQQQLKAINDVEFGYKAPKAEQYIEGERQLASLGMARAPGAPPMIRVASAADGDRATPFPAIVSQGDDDDADGPKSDNPAANALSAAAGLKIADVADDAAAPAIPHLTRVTLSRAAGQ